MTSIELTFISGSISIPYTVYACDVYGNNCILIATIVTTVPPTNTIFLPIQFNTAPAVGIKVITGDGCERFEIFDCIEHPSLCILLTSEAVGSLWNCITPATGTYGTKPYYRLLSDDCVTLSNIYIWWNSFSNRWEMTNSLGGGDYVYYYNNNPGDSPVSSEVYPWIEVYPQVMIFSSTIGECQICDCYEWYWDADSAVQTNVNPVLVYYNCEGILTTIDFPIGPTGNGVICVSSDTAPYWGDITGGILNNNGTCCQTPTMTPTPTPTITPTPTMIPNLFDFVTGFNCSLPSSIEVSIISLSGGVPPYQVGTNVFLSESSALSNTSWVSSSSIDYGVSNISDNTYWLVAKDSIGTILAKSVTTGCYV